MNGKTDQSTPPRLRLGLRQLEVFVAMVRGGSTRAAADRVSRSQSAASTSLADLEQALGVELFDRIGRRLVLNENGRALLPKAAALVDQVLDVQELFSNERATRLRLAASLTIGEYLLPERVAQWKVAHPGSRVSLMIGNTSKVIDAVVAFDVDVGFIEGAQTHPDLLVQPWLTDELVVVAAPGHELAHRNVTLAQLRAASWVLREQGSGTREAADRWLVESLGEFNVEFELGSTEAIKRLIGLGTGIGCLSRYSVTEAVADGRLVILKTRLPRATRKLTMVMHRTKHLGGGTAAFVRHCGGNVPGPAA